MPALSSGWPTLRSSLSSFSSGFKILFLMNSTVGCTPASWSSAGLSWLEALALFATARGSGRAGTGRLSAGIAPSRAHRRRTSCSRAQACGKIPRPPRGGEVQPWARLQHTRRPHPQRRHGLATCPMPARTPPCTTGPAAPSVSATGQESAGRPRMFCCPEPPAPPRGGSPPPDPTPGPGQ